MKGLGTTMKEYGYNWCEACDVFANHSALASSGSVRDKFQACLQAPISDYLPDDPPEASGRIRASDCKACPAGTISSATGKCEACAAGEQVVGNVCSPCTPGQIVSAAGVCTDCPAQSIVVNNTCVACDSDEAPNAARTTCEVCPIDLTVDWRTVPDTCNDYVQVSQSASTSASDTCPERFFINVTHLDDVFANDADATGVDIGVVSEVPTAAVCATSSSHLDVGPLSASGLTVLSSNDHAGGWSSLMSSCGHQDSYLLVSSDEIKSGATSRGLMVSATAGSSSIPTLVLLSAVGMPPGCDPK